MLTFLFLCILCYFFFLIGSLLLPVFIGLGVLLMILYGLKALFDYFAPPYRPSPLYRFYGRRNPIVWLTRLVWLGCMHALYQLIFTIAKAVNDGKNSYKK